MKSWLILMTLLIVLPSTTFQSTSTEGVTLQLGMTRITENDETVMDSGVQCSGAKVLAFHLPEEGWFVFTFVPYADYHFQKIAKVKGNKISFSLDDRKYEIISAEAISPEVQSLDLWVARIPSPADQADTNRKAVGCFSDFNLWERMVLKKERH